MIVPAMTPEEVYRELERDRDNLSRWWLHRRKEIARRALKNTKFPMQTWLDYISPRKNRYLILSIVTKRQYDKGNASAFCAIQRTEYGMAVFASWLNWQRFMTQSAYLPHVFLRYSQRAKVMKTGIDLIKHFFEHNHTGEQSTDQRFVGRSVRYNGKNYISMSVAEGVLLGEKVGSIFVAHTFITYDMATGKQREEFEKKKQKVQNTEELINTLNKAYKNIIHNP